MWPWEFLLTAGLDKDSTWCRRSFVSWAYYLLTYWAYPGENRGRGRPRSDFFQTVVWSLRINYSEFNLHVYGKRQTSDSSWEFLKIENEQIENEQIKKASNNSYGWKIAWITDLCVEMINSKRQVKGETWSRGTNSLYRLA